MTAVRGLAREHWDRQFRPLEEAEKAAHAEETERRRKAEMLYRLGLGDKPLLCDEYLYWGPARDAEGFKWAEARLISLGFRIETVDRVRTYTDERIPAVVFADPRQKGKLTFHVIKKPLPRRRYGRGPRKGLGSFYLLDEWHNSLRLKYEERLRPLLDPPPKAAKAQ